VSYAQIIWTYESSLRSNKDVGEVPVLSLLAWALISARPMLRFYFNPLQFGHIAMELWKQLPPILTFVSFGASVSLISSTVSRENTPRGMLG
jgi:hypothetical protein